MRNNPSLSRSFAICSCVLLLTATLVRADRPVRGKIEQIDSIRILRVSGTPQEMGYAHGFLLADAIAVYINDSAVSFSGGDSKGYAQLVELASQSVDLTADVRAELTAILEGVGVAKGEVPKLALAGRPMQVEDLIVANSMDALRAFGCSGFTVWGEAAGDAGVITARNFDFDIVSKTGMTNHILVRAPAGQKAVASVAPPGYIGVFTGINQDGVCVFLHDGDGPRMESPSGKMKPLAIAMSEALSAVQPSEALVSMEERLKAITPYPFSYMVRVVTPRSVDKKLPPARVFRIDANGFGENASADLSCLTTNHYLPSPEPTRSWSVVRLNRLTDLVTGVMTGRKAWEALAAVKLDQPDGVTLHSVVVYPEKRKLEIAFASLGGKVKAAPDNRHIPLTFDQLFGSPER